MYLGKYYIINIGFISKTLNFDITTTHSILTFYSLLSFSSPGSQELMSWSGIHHLSIHPSGINFFL